MGWRNASDPGPVNLRLFAYGPHRSGKTMLAATFPSPVFFVPPNEDSVESLRGMPIRYYIFGEPVNGATPALVTELRDQLETMLMAAMKFGPEGFWAKYGRTIVFDQVTLLSDMLLAEIQGDAEKASDKHWGLLRSSFINLRDTLWQLPAHIVITATDSVKMSREGVITQAGPRLQGEARTLLPGSTNLLGYTQQEPMPDGSTRFLCHFRKYAGFEAGARLGYRFPPCTLVCGDGQRAPTLYQQLAHMAGITR